MRSFWQRRPEDEVERLLRANRPEPRDEFVDSMLARLETKRQGPRQRLSPRVLAAGAVTALALGAGVAAGAVHVASTSISNLGNVAGSGIHGSKGDRGGNGNWGGNYETSVPVCHHTHSHRHHWVEIFLSPQAAANQIKHHAMDYIVGSPGNPTTCPP
jgi:hypothetical protein